jgi:hypothetical protein
MASYDMDRVFGGGATRDTEQGKPDYEGFLSPLVVEAYGRYMHKHRARPDGSYRASDNWQLGIPLDAYMKSGFRHFIDWWKEHRGFETKDGLDEALCALIFNASGYLHEVLKARDEARYNGSGNRVDGGLGEPKDGPTPISKRDSVFAGTKEGVGGPVAGGHDTTGRDGIADASFRSIGDATGTPY